MQAARAAARRVHALALRCDPIPEALAHQAVPFIDANQLRDPYNDAKTLDGRGVVEAWGEGARRNAPGTAVRIDWP